MHWEVGVDATYCGKEMIVERANGTFIGVTVVSVWRDELAFALVALNERLDDRRTLVVVNVWRRSAVPDAVRQLQIVSNAVTMLGLFLLRYGVARMSFKSYA
jgi:hypothetical protein